MVTLYTWIPISPVEALEAKVLPDVGHSALEVKADGREPVYISYWPETESLIAAVTNALKPRKARFPSSYEEEADFDAGFMQRPAEHVDQIADGLEESRIVESWAQFRDSTYDLLTWNCSNVTRYLLTRSIGSEIQAEIAEACAISPEDMLHISDLSDFEEKLRYLASSKFIDCRPEDVRRMVLAYGEYVEKTNRKPPVAVDEASAEVVETIASGEA